MFYLVGIVFSVVHISLASFFVTKAKSADPGQTPQNAASDQGLHCLLTELSIEILINMKNPPQQPFKRKWTGQINSTGKDHSADYEN